MCLIGLVDARLCGRIEVHGHRSSLSGSTGTRSKRNFHRPESNCGIALNSTFRVLIVFLRWLRLRIRSPRRSRDSVPQTRKKHSTPGFQASNFSSCYSLKHVKVEISQKREASFGMPWARHQGDRPATWGIFPLLGDDSSPVRFGLHVVWPRIAIYHNPVSALIRWYCFSRKWRCKTRIGARRDRD